MNKDRTPTLKADLTFHYTIDITAADNPEVFGPVDQDRRMAISGRQAKPASATMQNAAPA